MQYRYYSTLLRTYRLKIITHPHCLRTSPRPTRWLGGLLM